MIDRFIPKESLIRSSFWVAVFLLVGTFLLFALFFKSLPAQVPLFYSKPWGQDQLAQPVFLVLPLLLSVVFFALNVLLAERVFKTKLFVRNVLIAGAITAAILGAVTIARVILLIQ